VTVQSDTAFKAPRACRAGDKTPSTRWGMRSKERCVSLRTASTRRGRMSKKLEHSAISTSAIYFVAGCVRKRRATGRSDCQNRRKKCPRLLHAAYGAQRAEESYGRSVDGFTFCWSARIPLSPLIWLRDSALQALKPLKEHCNAK
jgi:hypothetical protein